MMKAGDYVVMMKAGDMMLLDSGNDEGWWYDVVR